jgi:hypothetical protein
VNFPVPWTTGEAFLSPISILSHLPPEGRKEMTFDNTPAIKGEGNGLLNNPEKVKQVQEKFKEVQENEGK